MASTKTAAAAAAEATPDVVYLKCEKLGEKARPFAPAHAKALLQLQADRGLSDWQPADAADVPTATE
ncbi:hypothetical protein [Hymenobacter nivis]|uniref:Uncharacterized protein n=1 Tax=Hymenobacter nivis TaxID=1850093 RepID=A0A502GUN1_9BACT|nr:hypothetical protein [Hymenobacter nivis]TPG66077.1 hypothetical protein EAH73_11955 [Hymenobacter nivis]